MRLYDEIPPRTAGTTPPVVVDISDVAKRLFEEGPGIGSWRKAFPVMLPPWEATFFEYEYPRRIKLPDGTIGGLPLSGRVATFCIVENYHPLTWHNLLDVLKTMRTPPEDAPKSYSPPGGIIPEIYSRPPSGTRAAVLFGHDFVFRGRESEYKWHNPKMMHVMLVDQAGACLEDSVLVMGDHNISSDKARGYDAYFYPVYQAISLLHCKNVSTIDHAPDPKVAKARARRGKPPGVVYKTLAVTVPGSKTPVRLGSTPSGVKRGEHIVRGHFATYGENNKLFGRLTGTFYHPMHVRGRNKDRKIVKDYRLVKGEEAA